MFRGVIVVLLAMAAVTYACTTFEEGEPAAVPDAGLDAPVAVGTDAGSDASADAATCACPGRAPCGVPLVSTAGSFCIDPHEVTEGAYAEFVAANLSKTIAVEPPCEALLVTSRSPGSPDLPATRVTFCEARAYCTWAGKRLCGHVSGQPLASPIDQGDLEGNAWLKACSDNGSAPTLSGTCRLGLPPDAGPAAVMTTCEGAFPGIFEMNGNVWEWIDSTSRNDAGVWSAHFLGGSWATASGARCSVSGSFITTAAADVGFRCCSP